MNIKDKTTDILIELGVNMSSKGAVYIADIMELFNNDEWRDAKLMTVYWKVAQMRNTSQCGVERCIRHIFQTLMKNQDKSLIEKYLDTRNHTNGANLSKLYYRISKELEG